MQQRSTDEDESQAQIRAGICTHLKSLACAIV